MLKKAVLLLVASLFGFLAQAIPTDGNANAIVQPGKRKSSTASINAPLTYIPAPTSISPTTITTTSTSITPTIPTLIPSDESCTCLRAGPWCFSRWGAEPGIAGDCSCDGLYNCTAADIGKTPSGFKPCHGGSCVSMAWMRPAVAVEMLKDVRFAINFY